MNGIYWLEIGCDILPDIVIYGKDGDDNLRTIHQIISTTYHELGHASHFTNARNKFIFSNLPLIESWASFVGYYLVWCEYQDLGYTYGPFSTGSYVVENGGYLYAVPYCIPDNSINRQLTEVKANEDYLPIFIDMYDKDNQWSLYDYYTNFIDYYLSRNLLPKDYIRSIPANILENFVFNSSNLSQIKTKLMYFCWGNTTEINEVYNLTIDNINLMFDLYEE
jgi:hypothetical protein